MKFRYHRGSLEDSLATEQDFNIDNICKEMGYIAKAVKIQIQFYAYDNRIDKALYAVMVDEFIIGFLYEDN